ncbi:MAG TPA: class I SAM-dependent methyltransferase [Pseudobacteroides sp.]|uniref:class I SAM-dependent methyltransferase n=1 Tax=Pseudobacteroides sp. TaxID=1968840 RepID=UPI002F949D0A
MSNTSDSTRKRYNRIARFFKITESLMEKGKMSLWRKAVWNEANGKVLEVGVGTGKNIQYYPESVEVSAIDFSEKMLEFAREKASIYGKKVDLRLMDVQALDFADETFDTIITTCVFCSVPDPIKGLKELKRVCKKDGQIIMLEHVRSKKPLVGIIMDLLNPIVVRIVGANINRNTIENLKQSNINVKIEKDLMLDIVKHLKCSI